MTLSYELVLRWRPDALSAAADRLRRQVAALEAQTGRVDATRRSTSGHWHGDAAVAAQHRLQRAVTTGEELLDALESARARLDGAADALGSARSRVRSVVDDAEASEFRVTPDGTVHPPYLPPPGFAPPSLASPADYFADFDARAGQLLDEAHRRTEELHTALRGAELADEEHATALRGVQLPGALVDGAFLVEQALPSVWGSSPEAVVFPEGWQPWPEMSRGSDASWLEAVLRDACVPGAVLGPRDDADDAGTGYFGGGFVAGPDGHAYPLVTPQVRKEDGLYRANANFGDPMVEDLFGTDQGWHQVGVTAGIAQFGKPTGKGTKVVIGGSALTGLALGPGTGLRRRKDLLPRVSVDGLGGGLLTAQVSPLPRSPARSFGDPRAMSDDPPGMNTERAGRIGGALALVTNAAGAASLVKHLDDNLTHGYALTLQQNEDGRRRALLDVYDVYDTSRGDVMVRRQRGYVDTNGDLALTEATTFSSGDVVSPGPGP